jgi:glycosyltransferase EpsD
MPSYHEGLPIAALEAMYCGVPVVVSNIRGLVDVIEDGVTGYLCEPNDSDAFAQKMSTLLGNPKLGKQMVERNKKNVVPFCIENTKKEVFYLVSDI